MQGIKFKMKDGTWDSYDPLEKDDFQELSDAYILDMNYQYEILKEEVEYFEWCELCEDCGHELYDDGCGRCVSEKELEQLKNELDGKY